MHSAIENNMAFHQSNKPPPHFIQPDHLKYCHNIYQQVILLQSITRSILKIRKRLCLWQETGCLIILVQVNMETNETAKLQFKRNSKWILGFYVKAYFQYK